MRRPAGESIARGLLSGLDRTVLNCCVVTLTVADWTRLGHRSVPFVDGGIITEHYHGFLGSRLHYTMPSRDVIAVTL